MGRGLYEGSVAARRVLEQADATLDLPLDKEGAYLVMVRGDDLYA